MRILVIMPGRLPKETEIGDRLEDLQAVVGGYIEVAVRFDDNTVLICNEEGKLLGLPTNRSLIHAGGALIDHLVGPLCICGTTEEDLVSLSDIQVITAKQRFSPDMMQICMEAGGPYGS